MGDGINDVTGEGLSIVRPMLTQRRRVLYFCDNGAVLCGDHLGATAKATGRDLSGLRIKRVSQATLDQWLDAMGKPMACETCGCIGR